MSNIASNSIKVFPAVRRSGDAFVANSRQLSEKNLVGLVNKLLDVDSFIISYDPNGGENQMGLMKFNIAGYYFEVSNFNNVTETYAKLVIDSTDDSQYPELKGDENGNYLGLEFTNAKPGDTDHWIQLRDSLGNVITSSFKYKATNVEGLKFDNIDGGTY